jgi:hypothetical protein
VVAPSSPGAGKAKASPEPTPVTTGTFSAQGEALVAGAADAQAGFLEAHLGKGAS